MDAHTDKLDAWWSIRDRRVSLHPWYGIPVVVFRPFNVGRVLLTATLLPGGALPYGQGLTLVPVSAQLELTLPLAARLKLTLSPI